MRPARPLLACLLALGLALSGCGGEEAAGPPATVPAEPAAPPTTVGPGARTDEGQCPPVGLPGHEARGIVVTGASCDDVRPVIAAAVGRGRAAYAAGGVRCQPTPAEGGATDYACTGGGVELAFLYRAR